MTQNSVTWVTAFYGGRYATHYIRPTGHYLMEVFETRKNAYTFKKNIIKDMKIEARKIKPIKGWRI
jgi:hypothetical protein